MDKQAKTRAELRRAYKEAPRQAGVYQVKNQQTGKVLLGSGTNLHGPLNKHRFTLSIGRHHNSALQEDWNRLGAEAFTFEILAVVKPSDDPPFNLDDELTPLEQIWLEKLGLPGEHGYNQGPLRRD
ncbi:MAG: GIY-YIG nuclease family protein [Deltaproteobacteria bacterium]|nr:GIY-YIG nuclease family protein [Deltaproteobacteria bacterium]